jgi:hypothetical protein
MEDDQSDATVRISNQDRQRVINRALADFATATNGRFPPNSAGLRPKMDGGYGAGRAIPGAKPE